MKAVGSEVGEGIGCDEMVLDAVQGAKQGVIEIHAMQMTKKALFYPIFF